jgi:hypothetical protein
MVDGTAVRTGQSERAGQLCRCDFGMPPSRCGLSMKRMGTEDKGVLCREKAEVRREERRRKRDAEEAAAKAAKEKDRKEKEAKPSGESYLSSM